MSNDTSVSRVVHDQDELERVIGPVSRETFRDLQAFSDHFQNWSRSINLISAASLQSLWSRHIVDSAQIVNLAGTAETWLDMGSGGGFPGLVLAILRRDIHVHLVESNRKKAAFLQSAVGMFGLNATIHACRIEECKVDDNVDVVSARALAALAVLLNQSEVWLMNGARALFFKGRGYAGELQESSHGWTYDLLTHESRTESESVVLEFRNVRRL